MIKTLVGSMTVCTMMIMNLLMRGDLDRCNGMVLDGTYGYYVTDNYPWVLKCHVGTPHTLIFKASMIKLKEDFWHHAH